MEDLTNVITEIGKQVIRLEVTNINDQRMSDPNNITPQKAERPSFETPGNQTKKTRTQSGIATNPLMALIQEVQNRGSTPRHTDATQEKNTKNPKLKVGETKATITDPTTELAKPNHTTQQKAITQNSSWY